KADEIARNIGIMPTSTHRIRACILQTLKDKSNGDGHSYYPFDLLVEDTMLKLNHTSKEEDVVEKNDLENVLDYLDSSDRDIDIEIYHDFMNSFNKNILIEPNRAYIRNLFIYEIKLADNLTNIVNYKKNASDNSSELGMLNHKIKSYQTKNRIILAEKQREAI